MDGWIGIDAPPPPPLFIHASQLDWMESRQTGAEKPVVSYRGRRNTIRSAHIKFHTFIEARGASRRGDGTRVVVGYRAGRKNGKMKAVEPGETS